MEATAALAYIKTTSNQGTTICFLMGKAKVAPLRQTTIPRLELQAALYAARLKKTIEDEMDFKLDKIFLWGDSTTVLSWIKNFKLKQKMYIGNRIAEIRDITSTNQWTYVNTKDNPADQGRRGLKVTEMTEKYLWLQGPQFLLFSNNNCTIDEQQHENVFLNSGEQKSQVTGRQSIDKDLIDANKFSQWLKLRGIIIKINNLPSKTKSRDQQITDAENFLFRLSQQQPIILDGRHRIIHLFLELKHNINGHVGVEQQTHSSQLNYWVLQCKTVMKKISNRCYE